MKRLLHKLIHLIIMPCDKATLIIEKQLCGKLTTTESLRLKAHLHWCKVCPDYYKKAKTIDVWLRKVSKRWDMQEFIKEEELETFKKRIKKQVHTHS